MPRFKIQFIPRGSWTIVVEAPNREEALNVADSHFDMVTQASDAEWEVDFIEETNAPAEAFYEAEE